MSDRTPGRNKSPRKGRGRGRGGSSSQNTPPSSSRNETDNSISVPAAGSSTTRPASSLTLEQMATPKTSDSSQNPTHSVSGSVGDESNATTMSSVSDSSQPFCSPRGNFGATDLDSFATPSSGRDIDIDVDKLDPVFSPPPGLNPESGPNSPETIRAKSEEKDPGPCSSQAQASTSTSVAKPEKPPRKISSEKAPPSKTLLIESPPPPKSGPLTVEIVAVVAGTSDAKETTSTPLSVTCKSPLTSPKYLPGKVQGQSSTRDDPWTGSYPGEDRKTSVTKRPTVSELRDVAATFTGRQWSCLILFGLADFFSAMVTSLQAPFYPPEAERKGATASEYGLVFGVHELVVFLTSPIFGKYMNRLGPRPIFLIGIMTTALSCVAFGLLDQIPTHTPFIALSLLFRILEALGASAFVTSSFAILAVEFPNSVATTFASLETFYGLGLIVGPSVGGALFEVGGFILPFAVTGAGLFAIGVGAAFVMPKIERISEPDGSSTEEQGIFSILKVPGVALSTVALVMTANAIGFLSATLEPHLRPFALSPTQVGLVFIIYGGVYAILAPFIGRICDRISSSSQIYVILLGQVLIPLAFIWIGPAPFLPELETSVWLTAVGLVILGCGLACTLVAGFISCLSEATKYGFPDNLSTYGVVSGLWTSAVSLGAFLGPSIGGFLYDNFSFRRGTYYIFGTETIVIVLILLFILFRKPHPPVRLPSESEPLLRSISPILGERKSKICPEVGVAGAYGAIGDSQA